MLDKRYTAIEIAEIVSGQIIGNELRTVDRTSLPSKTSEDCLCFIHSNEFEAWFPKLKAGVIVADIGLFEIYLADKRLDSTFIIVDDVVESECKFLNSIVNKKTADKFGEEQPSVICETTRKNIGKNVYIGAFSYVGENVSIGDNVKIYPQVFIGDNVTIGNDTTIYPGVKIYHDCHIGNRCNIHAGAVIGSDGFVYSPNDYGTNKQLPTICSVYIQDNVDIYPNSVIERGFNTDTVIEFDSKVGIITAIGHDVRLGRSTIVCGQAGVAGQTTIGEHCILGAQAGVSGGVNVTDYCVFGAQAGVPGNVNQPGTYLGSPAIPVGTFRRAAAKFKQSGENK